METAVDEGQVDKLVGGPDGANTADDVFQEFLYRKSTASSRCIHGEKRLLRRGGSSEFPIYNGVRQFIRGGGKCHKNNAAGAMSRGHAIDFPP